MTLQRTLRWCYGPVTSPPSYPRILIPHHLKTPWVRNPALYSYLRCRERTQCFSDWQERIVFWGVHLDLVKVVRVDVGSDCLIIIEKFIIYISYCPSDTKQNLLMEISFWCVLRAHRLTSISINPLMSEVTKIFRWFHLRIYDENIVEYWWNIHILRFSGPLFLNLLSKSWKNHF